MYLSCIQINNFRNIKDCYISLSEGLNLFCGNNAQGKTNLLEAIFYLVTGRSFRTRFDRECIPLDSPREQVSLIRGEVYRSAGSLDLLVGFTSSAKKIHINEKPIERLGLLWGKVNAVLFTPNDLLLLKGAPLLRRKMIDIEFSQVSATYLLYLQRFNEALRQRNAIFRSDSSSASSQSVLDAWDEQIADAAAEIVSLRRKFLNEIERYAQVCYDFITDNKEKLSLIYDDFLGLKDSFPKDKIEIKKKYLALLEETRDEDFYRGTTNEGPHHDDWICKINGNDIKVYGSQGQQRSAILAIRLAEIEFMKSNVGETPILLLDDIISEIDETRLARFFEFLNQPLQTIITSTTMEQVTSHAGAKKIFIISDGRFEQKKI